MNKQIITIIGMILLISSVSAITIIAGNSYSFESEQFEYYTAVGNSSNMNGMEVNWENGITTLDFNLLFKPDTFSLIFFNEKEVIKEVKVGGGSSGGGTRIIYRDRNITTYVDREIEVEKIFEINNSDNSEKIEEPIESGITIWYLLLGFIIFILGLGIILFFGWVLIR